MKTDKTPPGDSAQQKGSDASLIQLLPNLLTLAAICAGLTAIRFAVQGNYALAVQLVLLACVIDGIDGRLARLLDCDSKIGAELDSLADFLNFGVTPPLIIYFWGLQDIRSAAWMVVLFFAVCCVIRLARFNVGSKSGLSGKTSGFVGVPSPAGALLVMLPMYISFASDAPMQLPGLGICVYMVVVGLLMISSIPTMSFKGAKVSRANVKYILVGFVMIGAAILTFTWTALIALSFAYLAAVAWSSLKLMNRPKRQG